MVVQTPPGPPSTPDPDIEAGVIEDARRRQQRHRRIGALVIALTAVLAGGLILGFAGGGGGPGGGRNGGGHDPAGVPGGHGLGPAAAVSSAREVSVALGASPTLHQLLDNFAVLRRPQTAVDRSWRPQCDCSLSARQLTDLTRFAVKLPGGYRVFLDVRQFLVGGQEGMAAGSYVLELDLVDRYGNTSSEDFGPNTGYSIYPLSPGGPRAAVSNRPQSRQVLASVVPDGVASVSWTFTFRCPKLLATRVHCPALGTRTFTVPVVNNIAARQLPGLACYPLCAHVSDMVWRSPSGRVFTSFSGYGKLAAPPFLSGKLGRGTRRVLSSNGIAGARIGENASTALKTLTRLLGPPADAAIPLSGSGTDQATVWSSPELADPLTVYQRDGRFVGYQYGAPADQTALMRGPGAVLATERGLTLSNSIATARHLYPADFSTRASRNVGYWSAAAGGAKLHGSAIPNYYPARTVAAADRVATIGAGTLLNGTPRPATAPTFTPGPGASAQTLELYYWREAALSARKSGECPVTRPSTIPAAANGTPDRALLADLAVLQQPRTTADQLPRSLRGNEPRERFVNYIRLARTTNGVSYYVVPTSAPSGFSAFVALSPRCLTAIADRVSNETRQLPAKLRTQTRRLTA